MQLRLDGTPVHPVSQYERINEVRDLITMGGQVEYEDGRAREPDGRIVFTLAQSVCDYDLADWVQNGEEGPKPRLIDLLRNCVIGGKRVTDDQWVAIARGAGVYAGEGHKFATQLQQQIDNAPTYPMPQRHTGIEELRSLLLSGGTVAMPDGSARWLDAPLAATLAPVVVEHDMLIWEGAGAKGTAPSLIGFLQRCKITGEAPTIPQWQELLTTDHGLDDVRMALQNELIEHDQAISRSAVLPDAAPHHRLTPQDVVRLRNELTGWLETSGPDYYQDGIDRGRQAMFVRGFPSEPPALALARAERHALIDADLFFIDADMCQLVAGALPTMPAFAPAKSDLPAEIGFAVFALPLAQHYNRPSPHAPKVVLDDGTDINELLDSYGSQVVALTWRQWRPENTAISPAGTWAGGGIWVTFYAVTMSRVLGRTVGGQAGVTLRAAGEGMASLVPENEMGIAWFDPVIMDADQQERYLLDHLGTGAWMRAVLAAFQLARQAGLAETVTAKVKARPVNKAKARKTGRKEVPGGMVRVVQLRQHVRAARDQEAAEGAASGRVYKSRWIVRGFWRNTWYGKTGVHRPQWIAPYTKGPKGAPLLRSERVMLVTPPKNG